MEPSQGDLTPLSSGETDVVPLGRGTPKPAHERTASEDGGDAVQWEVIAAMPEFQNLVKAKLRFIIPATIFFVCYYLLLLILVGFFPDLMKIEVFGRVNIAYAFGLSQFFMAWVLAAIYVKVAAGWDRLADGILAKTKPR